MERYCRKNILGCNKMQIYKTSSKSTFDIRFSIYLSLCNNLYKKAGNIKITNICYNGQYNN